MEGLIVLSILFIGAFLFSFIGVIFLLNKTKTQEKSIRELRRRIEKIVTPNVTMASAQDVSQDTPPDITAPNEMMLPAETAPHEEAAGPASSTGQNRFKDVMLSFIKGGNLWAAGGVILLTAGFGTLIAYLGRRGFFTVEMGIAAAAAVGLIMILSGWRFRRKRPLYFIILQGGGIGILYLSIFAAHKLTPHLGVVLSLVLISLLIPPAVILALVQNSQGLAVLGFLGGFAAPLLLSEGGGNHLFLFTYYLVLNGGVLAIDFFRKGSPALSEHLVRGPGGGFRSWKWLNLLAFFFTFVPSFYWVVNKYTQEFFLSSEPFFLVYIVFFTVLGLRGLKNQELGFQPENVVPAKTAAHDYRDIILILGTPAAAAALQWKVFSFIEHGYALIAVAFSAFYLTLTVIILKKGGLTLRSYAEGYLALGTLLANLVIPLELSPRISGAIWAAEGAIIFFFGLRAPARNRAARQAEDPGRGDRRIMAAGIVVHIAAAVAFIRDISFTQAHKWLWNWEEPASWRSPAFIGSLIIAVSALVMAILAEKLYYGKEGKKRKILAVILAFWGFAWWFCGWYFEFQRVLLWPEDAFLILSSISGTLSWLAVTFFGLKFFIIGMVPAPLTAAFTVIGIFAGNFHLYFAYRNELIFTHNFFDFYCFRGWFSFLLLQGLTIFLYRKGIPDTAPESAQKKKIRTPEPAWFRDIRIFLVVLTALAVFSATGRFYTMEYDLSVSWTSLAGLLPLFAALIIIPFCQRPGQEPRQAKAPRRIVKLLPFILSGILLLWFIVSLFLPGNPSPLPFYVPVLNPLDLLEGLCIVSLLFWQIKGVTKDGKTGKKKPVLGWPVLVVTGDVLIFFWIVSILVRSVHYYAGIYWSGVPGSDEFQFCLFIFWAFYGIFHIILGHRKKLRTPWIAGTVLVGADIAKLILFDMRDIGAIPRILSFFAAGLVLLFIGWAAPLPPPRIKPTQEGGKP